MSEAEGLVQIDQPATMNLLGLIMGNVIERNLARPEHRALMQKLAPSQVTVVASGMEITLCFGEEGLMVTRQPDEQAKGRKARIEGSLDSMIGVALGGGMVGPWLGGKLKTKGSLFLLLKLRPLLLA